MKPNLNALTLRIFSRILAEAPTKKPKKEAPDDAPLGNYAFAEFRRDLPFGIERDTEEEKDLGEDLIQHFSGDRPMSPESVELMQTIISNGWYKNIIRRPKQPEVYRGIRMDKAWLAANVGKDWEKKFKKGKGFIEVDLELSPPNGEPVASWTTDISIAKGFSAPNNRTDKIGVIFYAKVKDNPDKFIDGQALYAVPDFSDWEDEVETIGVGPISVYKIAINTEPTRRY
jgi:hypothetical protein